MNRTHLPLPLIFGAVVLAQPAGAQGSESPQTEIVTHADLDLGTPEGAVAIEARLRAAARRVCRRVSPDAYLPVESACRRRAVMEGRRHVVAMARPARSARLARKDARKPAPDRN